MQPILAADNLRLKTYAFSIHNEVNETNNMMSGAMSVVKDLELTYQYLIKIYSQMNHLHLS